MTSSQAKIVEEVKRDAAEKWAAGNFPGWRVSLVSGCHGNKLHPLQKDTGSAMAKHSGAHLDLSAFSSPEVLLTGQVEYVCCHGDVDVSQELMSLGLDRLKSGLIALGLKCGG